MDRKEISITLNGMQENLLESTTIADLIALKEEKDGGLIVELNNKYVFSQQYAATILSDGDKVEFINPDFGG